MSNVFRQLSSNTKPFIIFAWPIACVLAAMAIILMFEDYATSRAGYLVLPTQKVNSGIVTFAVAALPQAGQIVLFYIFGRDTKKGWAALLAACFFVVDTGTDAWFKSGSDWSLMPLAVVESLFVFTLGSEILFTISVGFITEAFGEFIVALTTFVRTVLDALKNAFEALGISSSDEVRR